MSRMAVGPYTLEAMRRMKAWANENPQADTQGLIDEEWLGLAQAAAGRLERMLQAQAQRIAELESRTRETS